MRHSEKVTEFTGEVSKCTYPFYYFHENQSLQPIQSHEQCGIERKAIQQIINSSCRML